MIGERQHAQTWIFPPRKREKPITAGRLSTTRHSATRSERRRERPAAGGSTMAARHGATPVDIRSAHVAGEPVGLRRVLVARGLERKAAGPGSDEPQEAADHRQVL